MTTLIIQIILFIVLFAGILFIPVGVPGTFLAAAAVLIWRLVEGGDTFMMRHFIVFLALAVSGEVVEQIASIFGTKKRGASKYGMAGAFLGGIAGAVVGSMVIPVVGTIIGVFAGSFTLTVVLEMTLGKKTRQDGVNIGVGALIGKLIAVTYKYAIGIVMLFLIAWRFWVK
jgi:hypothetical protein